MRWNPAYRALNPRRLTLSDDFLPVGHGSKPFLSLVWHFLLLVWYFLLPFSRNSPFFRYGTFTFSLFRILFKKHRSLTTTRFVQKVKNYLLARLHRGSLVFCTEWPVRLIHPKELVSCLRSRLSFSTPFVLFSSQAEGKTKNRKE